MPALGAFRNDYAPLSAGASFPERRGGHALEMLSSNHLQPIVLLMSFLRALNPRVLSTCLFSSQPRRACHTPYSR